MGAELPPPHSCASVSTHRVGLRVQTDGAIDGPSPGRSTQQVLRDPYQSRQGEELMSSSTDVGTRDAWAMLVV